MTARRLQKSPALERTLAYANAHESVSFSLQPTGSRDEHSALGYGTGQELAEFGRKGEGTECVCESDGGHLVPQCGTLDLACGGFVGHCLVAVSTPICDDTQQPSCVLSRQTAWSVHHS
jgi:hypothetical protein